MCGITGFWTPGMNEENATHALTCMQEALRHRGPDDWGIWHDRAAGVGFGQRRLAIIDLSPLGHQPMTSASGRYTLNYNGEVYNYQPIMQELADLGHTFRGHSDTEVMLAAFEQWGIEAAVKRFVGMFAFSLWDAQEQTLHLVRDRLGIKPLYYGWQRGSLLFASELKALRQHPDFVGEIDRNALALYFRHNYVPAPWSIYKGIYKQTPGTILSFRSERDTAPTETVYWSLESVAEAGARTPFAGDDVEAVDSLEAIMRDAVRLRMIADVPLGAFLSGGIDSSLVVALMQAQSNQPVRTFSIGFRQNEYDEAPYARAIARHLGTDHTELYVEPAHALDVIPRLPRIFDEPFSDSSQIPTFLVSEMTRRHVTVSLSGDGGDELFGGYRRYAQTLKLWNLTRRMTPIGRKVVASGAGLLPDSMVNQGMRLLESVTGRQMGSSIPANKLRMGVNILGLQSPQALYHERLSHWKSPETLVLGSSEPMTLLTNPAAWPRIGDFHNWMMYIDTKMYLPDDILVKVDRTSMAVALEARVPLIDHRVVEFAWRLPIDLKVRNGQTKWILRQVLQRHVPPALYERAKKGFGAPIAEWLRGPLREWALNLTDANRITSEGYLNAALITQRMDEHQRGAADWSYSLWDVLMFQAWLEEERSGQLLAAASGA